MSAMVFQAASVPALSVPARRQSTCVQARGASPVQALHLTRRGRLVFFGIPALLAAAATLFAAMGIIFGSIASPAHASVEFESVSMRDYATTVTVLEGESLWSIASDSNPGRNAREVVQEIVALNDLGAGMIHAGQQIFVPLPK